jgi:hypothetical protein
MKIIISESQYKRLNESLNEKETIQNKIKEDGWNKLLKYNNPNSILSRGFDNNPFEFLNIYNDLEMVISQTSSNIMLFRKKPNDNLMVFNLLTKKMYINNTELWMILEDLFKLTPEQTKYYFLSGFTAKLAGTERGVTQPEPTFSACFGKAFLSLHPTQYGQELVKKMEQHKATAYMVNTGWNGTGKRISIKDTRAIIDAILDGSIEKAETKMIPTLNFEVPTALHDVDSAILDPRDTYADASEWQTKAEDLAGRFIKNFVQYTDNEEGQNLVKSGPQV